MTNASTLTRWTAAAAVAAVTLATFAPAAEAGRRHVRYKGGPSCGSRVVVQPVHRTVVYERGSSVAPVLAGLIGGFVLGTAVSHAQPAVEVRTTFFDPYCDVYFGSLDRYDVHLRRHHHPRTIRVIEVGSGECLHTYAWRAGEWRCDDDCGHGRGYDRYDGRYDDRYDDRDWDD
jgi:hypothetical protein